MSIYDSLPDHKKHLRKIQLGSGGVINSDWINMDFTPAKGVDIVYDLRQGLPFGNEEIEEFYSHHVLEHFDYYEVRKLLSDCLRCAKHGAIIKAVVPNFKEAAERWLKQQDDQDLLNMLMVTILGGQAVGWEPKAGHTHSWGYSPETLEKLFVDTGFIVESTTNTTNDPGPPVITIVARKK